MDKGIICSLTSPNVKDAGDPPKSFTFDGAYGIDSTTEAIYNDVAFPIVEVSSNTVRAFGKSFEKS